MKFRERDIYIYIFTAINIHSSGGRRGEEGARSSSRRRRSVSKVRAGWDIFLFEFHRKSLNPFSVGAFVPGHGRLTALASIYSPFFSKGNETRGKTQHWQRLQTKWRRVVLTHEQSSVRAELKTASVSSCDF